MLYENVNTQIYELIPEQKTIIYHLFYSQIIKFNQTCGYENLWSFRPGSFPVLTIIFYFDEFVVLSALRQFLIRFYKFI